jgi:peptidoglycan/xylan/chitin deacetylase (PgdA/CDA1 family)
LGKKIPILAYHKIDEAVPTRHWIAIRDFDAQMSTLRTNGFEAVTLEDIWQYTQGNRDLPEKPISLTFDDGYQNFYTKAYPILRKYGFVATAFLPTDYIRDDVRHTNDWDRSSEERVFPTFHLLWTEVKELHKGGMLIGAHTQTHPDLASLYEIAPAQARAEIIGSKAEIESRLGVPVNFLSYPYTSSNETLDTLVQAAGFHGAVIVNNSVFDTAAENWFRMDRIAIYSDDPIKHPFVHW